MAVARRESPAPQSKTARRAQNGDTWNLFVAALISLCFCKLGDRLSAVSGRRQARRLELLEVYILPKSLPIKPISHQISAANILICQCDQAVQADREYLL